MAADVLPLTLSRRVTRAQMSARRAAHRGAARILQSLAGFIALGAPRAAGAHDGRALEPHDLAGAWSSEPWAIALLVASLGVYAFGARRIAQRRMHGPGGSRPRTLAFLAGWVMLAIALLSPIHALGGVLLSAHMVQHELLMAVATPLLVLGRPLAPALWATSPASRRWLGRLARRPAIRATWRAITHPLAAALIHGAAIWIWHARPLYEAGLRSDAMHAMQHVAFITTALLFWWAIFNARRTRSGEVVLALFLTALHTGALGALLTFAGSLWYPAYASTTGPWGLSPLEDQQLAGLIMWIPGGTVYLIVALLVAARWLSAPPDRGRRWLATAAVAWIVTLGTGCRGGLDDDHSMRVLGGSAERGKVAIGQYGCPACHVIPGIAGANGTVGPPLTGISTRAYIAGVITNSPDNMVRWITDPPAIDSLTAMPDLGVSDSVARDIAEYLYRIR